MSFQWFCWLICILLRGLRTLGFFYLPFANNEKNPASFLDIRPHVVVVGNASCILIYSYNVQIWTIPEKRKRRGGEIPDPRQGNAFQSKQRRRSGEPSDFMYFKSAQTKLFWREMKIMLQCLLKFNIVESLAMIQKCWYFQEASNIKWD